MELDESVTLVIRPSHRVSLAMEEVRKELDTMMQLKLISPAPEPTE